MLRQIYRKSRTGMNPSGRGFRNWTGAYSDTSLSAGEVLQLLRDAVHGHGRFTVLVRSSNVLMFQGVA